MASALIVGAGIGGLACALALRRSSWDVRVFERTERPRELGFGIGLARNAIESLRELGIGDALLSRTIVPRAAEVRFTDGRRIRRFELGRSAAGDETPWPRIVLRPTLHDALREAVGADAIVAGRQVIGCLDDGTGATVRFADGGTATGDIVVGADGIHSTVRAQLHPHEAPPVPSGYFALRGASTVVDRLGGLQAILYYGRGVECGVVQASADRIYWFFSLLADDVRCAGRDPYAVLRNWLPRFDSQFRAIAAGTPAHDLRLDELMTRPPLMHWGHGRITLLGDAAHPMLPHTAQGAAQALEDAVGLGRALRGTQDQAAALRRYEEVRAARTAQVVRLGPRIAAVAMASHPLAVAARTSVIRMLPLGPLAAVLARMYRDPNRALGAALS
jgi:2-polyprenyl-6-methoxyphenol hydroxylase-like FAD-dependent oxidoreductase